MRATPRAETNITTQKWLRVSAVDSRNKEATFQIPVDRILFIAGYEDNTIIYLDDESETEIRTGVSADEIISSLKRARR